MTDAAEVAGAIKVVRDLYVAEDVRRYVVALTAATRTSPEVRLGASPRATLHLLRTARAAAALDGRDYVLPDDVSDLAVPLLAHRLLLAPEAFGGAFRRAEDVVADLVATVPVPTAARRR